VFERIPKPEFLAGVEEKGKNFVKHLEALREKYSEVIKDIHGKGLFLGAQLDRDPTEIVEAWRGDCLSLRLARIHGGMCRRW